MNKKKLTIIICTAIIIILCAVTAIVLMPHESSVSVTEMLSTAQKYLIETDYERAIAEFNKVIKIDPMNTEAYLGLAEAYEKNGQHDMAVETLEKGYEATGDDRIKAALEALLGGVDDIMVTSAPQTAVLSEETSYKSGDTVSLESYSDGTKRSEIIYTDDNGAYDIVYYYYQGAELLRESYSADGKLIDAAADISFIEQHPLGEALYTFVPDVNYKEYALKRGLTNINVSSDRASFLITDKNQVGGNTQRTLNFDKDGNIIYTYDMGEYLEPYSCVASYYTDGKAEIIVYYNDTVEMGSSIGTFELGTDSYKIETEGEYVDRGLGISHIYIEYSDGVVTERQYSRNGRNLRYTEENVKNGTIYNNVYYANGDLYMSSELDIDSGKLKMKYTDMDSEEIIERDYSYDDNGEIITSKSSDGRQVSYYELSKNIATFKQYDENGDLWSEIETDYENRTAKYYIFEQDYKARYNEEWHYDENGIRITERYDVSNYDWNEEKEIYYDEPYHSQTFKSNYLTGESSRIYYNSDGSIRSMDNSYYNDDGISISESRSAGGVLLYKHEFDPADGSEHSYSYMYDENGNLISEETY